MTKTDKLTFDICNQQYIEYYYYYYYLFIFVT